MSPGVTHKPAASNWGTPESPFFFPRPTAKAGELLGPCIAGIGRRYDATLTLAPMARSTPGSISVQIEGLAIYVPETIAVTSPLMKDLQNGLDLRRGRLLDHPVVLRRGVAPPPASTDKTELQSPRSLAQAAINSCILPMTMVVRRIESSEDFIRYYGHCIIDSKPLKVNRILPVLGRHMSVLLASAADSIIITSLNGSVTVNSADGPVTISITAYPETL